MPKQLTKWLDEFVENGADPSDVTEWPENSGGGGSYTPGNGINIVGNEISVDTKTIATKEDLNDYEPASEAFSGDYNDLDNKPTIPTDTSDLTNEAGFITGITSTDVTTALGYTPGTSNFSGDYGDLTNQPTIPDAVSGTNDGTNWISLTIGSVTKNIPTGGGSSYTAGIGIDITNNEISVDNTVAMKTDITNVEANSEQTPTDTLNNLKIGSTVYDFNTTGVPHVYDHTTSTFDVTYSNYNDPGLHVVHSSQPITIKSGKDSSGNVLSVTCGQSKYVLVFIASSDNNVEHKTYWYAFWGHASNKMSYGYYDRAKESGVNSGYINTVEMNRLQNKLVTYTVTLDLTDGTDSLSADIQFTMPYTYTSFDENSFKALFNNGSLQVAHTTIIKNGTTYKMDDIKYDSQEQKYSDLEGTLYTSTGFSFTTYEH